VARLLWLPARRTAPLPPTAAPPVPAKLRWLAMSRLVPLQKTAMASWSNEQTVDREMRAHVLTRNVKSKAEVEKRRAQSAQVVLRMDCVRSSDTYMYRVACFLGMAALYGVAFDCRRGAHCAAWVEFMAMIGGLTWMKNHTVA
jgi:hypothetical protein